jgi:hypothetical protein
MNIYIDQYDKTKIQEVPEIYNIMKGIKWAVGLWGKITSKFPELDPFYIITKFSSILAYFINNRNLSCESQV